MLAHCAGGVPVLSLAGALVFAISICRTQSWAQDQGRPLAPPALVGMGLPEARPEQAGMSKRMMLYEAAQSMLVRAAKWSRLKGWAMKIARHRGMKKAIVALARRLAVIMHRMWVDGTDFRWTREVAAA
jgi:hypothetical protein